MLELLFRGFFEWIYSLIVDIWGFIAGGLLDIMGLDFAYIQSHVPIMDDMARVLMAAGWALLLGNLVFQALKSMAAGLGFEGEDPKLLFTRTFVFAFLLLASPQICRIGLDLTSSIMDLLSIPDATNVSLVDESVFGTLTASWLMAIICSVIVMFKVLGLLIEIAERYVILAMLTLTAPLAFAMGGSKNTASIFTGWCRMFGSMCLLMVTNLVCFKMLFSVVSTVPSGLDVLPWMVLIFAIVKVAKKSDAIITRIGLNPAITGGPGRTLPGMLAYTVVRTAVSGVAKGVTGGGSGGGKTAGASAFGAGSGKPSGSTRFNGSRFSTDGGGRFSGTRTSGEKYQAGGQRSGGRGNTKNTEGQTQGGRYTYHSSDRQNSTEPANTRQENSSQASTQQNYTSSAAANTARGGGRPQQTRRSSVPPGTRHPHSYIPPSGAATTPMSGAAGAGSSQQPGASHSGAAGTAPKGTAPKQPNAAQPGAAGTGTHSQSTRSTHSAGGSTVNSTSQASSQTNVTTNGGRPGASGGKAPPTAPRPPHPGGPAASKSPPKPGDTRATRRDKAGTAPKPPAAPSASGASQPGGAGRPSRSTQRPADSTPRPGRNTPPATVTPPSDGTSSSPARQEPRTSAKPASTPVKGGAPTVRPGGAGTAPAGKQAAGQSRTAKARTTRAKPVHRPPPNRRGGNSHG